LPDDLAREEVRHRAGPACQAAAARCGAIGEDVSETLDYVPGRFKVFRHSREPSLALAQALSFVSTLPDGVLPPPQRTAAGRGGLRLFIIAMPIITL
jgi:hypothetical protein